MKEACLERREWRTISDYEAEYLKNTCEREVREEIGCTKLFMENGFLKDSHWDRYAEYRLLCRNCPHYYNNVGIYFGKNQMTDDYCEKEGIWIMARIRNEEEWEEVLSSLPKSVKFIKINDIRTVNLSGLEQFPELQSVSVCYCPGLLHFWDFSRTPDLRAFGFMSNRHLSDLTELEGATGLEYFEIDTLFSRTNLMYVDSLVPLQKLQSLREVTLNAISSRDGALNALIDVPNLEKIWVSPHAFTTEQYAEFEARKFRIYDEYGIYRSGDYVRPLGKGESFRSAKAKEAFMIKYRKLMSQY